MSRGGLVTAYGIAAALVSLLSLAAALAVAPRGTDGWLALGWGLMAAIGVAGGCWLQATHGTAGSGFLLALGAGMLGRLVAAGVGGVTAVQAGEQAVWGYVGGLAAGYVPLQVLEVAWFKKMAGRAPDGPEGSAGS